MLENRRFNRLAFGVALSLCLGLISCGKEDLSVNSVTEEIWFNCLTREVWTPEKEAWCAKLELLRNSQYQISDFGLIQLMDGVYENPSDQVSITLIDEPGAIAYGDLADGSNIALALLRTESGGTGIFFYLAALVEADNAFENLAIVLLGDRVITQSIALEAGLIKVHLIKQGPDDPQCCPTLEALQTYELQGGELTLLSEEAADVDNKDSEDNPLDAD